MVQVTPVVTATPRELVFTKHAQRQMQRRGLPEELVRRIVATPDYTQQRADGRTAYVHRIVDEHGDWYRYLKVVAEEGPPFLVITAYDRGNRR